jgi:glucose-1-phosphate thymidylyltransferase
MKGIILAGGSGTRLHPLTRSISKVLLPVYDKPMIYYPLSTLMLAGIKEILIISASQDISRYKELLGDGADLGLSLSYKVETSPKGIAQAFIIAEQFIRNERTALILGDNLFYGNQFQNLLLEAVIQEKGAVAFGYYVQNPKPFGVIGFSKDGTVTSIEEKPSYPKSNYAVTGLYFFDNRVTDIAKKIKPSQRGELEITDVINDYLKRGELSVKLIGPGNIWMDTGTHQTLYDASKLVRMLEETQNIKIACIEEIAYQKGYITKEKLYNLAKPLMKSNYGKYLTSLL